MIMKGISVQLFKDIVMTPMHVNSAALNVRSMPAMGFHNILLALPFGYPVLVSDDASVRPWISIHTIWQAKFISGFVNSGYLRPPLPDATEALIAAAAMAWTTNDINFVLPDRSRHQWQSADQAKPNIADFICADQNVLVIAKGMTQLWALANNLKIVRYPLLEDGRLDDRRGNITGVMKNLI